jgi:hypothetical protein
VKKFKDGLLLPECDQGTGKVEGIHADFCKIFPQWIIFEKGSENLECKFGIARYLMDCKMRQRRKRLR